MPNSLYSETRMLRKMHFFSITRAIKWSEDTMTECCPVKGVFSEISFNFDQD